MTEEKVQRVFFWTGLVLMTGFCLLPFIFMLFVSLSTRPDFLLPDISFHITANNYLDVLKYQL